MAKKKHWLLHSQTIGTLWFAVALITILACAFFFFPPHRNSPEQAVKEQKNIADLQKKEDSAYRSRRGEHASKGGDHGTSLPPSGRRDGKGNFSERGNAKNVSYYTTTPPAPTRQPLVVELNSADTTTLQLLHGIGPAFARRIVRYRERLGGFTSTDQLLEVYGFTPELLAHIRPHLRLNTHDLRKINVNTLPLKELIKHPYMEYYFARDLVSLRSRGATFSSPDDLRALPSCNDTLLAKLLPYLDFEK